MHGKLNISPTIAQRARRTKGAAAAAAAAAAAGPMGPGDDKSGLQASSPWEGRKKGGGRRLCLFLVQLGSPAERSGRVGPQIARAECGKSEAVQVDEAEVKKKKKRGDKEALPSLSLSLLQTLPLRLTLRHASRLFG